MAKTNPKNSFGQDLYAQLLQGAGGQDYIDDIMVPKLFPDDPARMEQLNSVLADNSRKNELEDMLAGMSSRKTKKRIGLQTELDDIIASQQNAGDELGKMFAKHKSAQDAFAAKPLGTKVDIGNGATANSLKNTGSLLLANAQAHPFATAGLGVLGAVNLSGLMDDDKIGGQLVGGGLGLAAPALMTKLGMAAPTPIGKIAMVGVGGALGSLFDKLRAKKEAEQAAAQQYAQY
jgi:hypothetical protein